MCIRGDKKSVLFGRLSWEEIVGCIFKFTEMTN